MNIAHRILLLSLALSMVAATACAERPANGTIGLYLDDQNGNDLSRAGVVKKGQPFELVVRIDSDSESSALVFQMTELNLLYPGVFKVSTWKYNETIFDLGRNDIGEYAFAYADVCAQTGGVDMVRVGYAHVSGPFPNDVVLYVHGIPDDTLHLPVLEGAPGYIDCGTDETWALAPEPWVDQSYDPTIIPGVTSTDGLLVLNPAHMVPVGSVSLSVLKTRF